jgi:hypothetical protein
MREADVEDLLLRERRAARPFGRPKKLYHDTVARIKDANRGPARMRERALSYNRAMRWVLVPYIRRWLAIAASLFLAIAPIEALAAQAAFFVIPAAAIAVACCIAVTVSALTVAVYLLLGTGWD